MKSLRLLLGCAGALAFAIVSSAQVLMLDFGPTTASGASRTNSPYHTADDTFTDTTWNRLGTADVASGLLWSDGVAATDVSVNLGATTTDGSRTVDLGNTPSNGTGLTGSAMTSGVYADTSPARDGIFTGSSSGNIRAVGLQISGLSTGTYEIYMTGRNTNTTGGHVQNFYAGKAASSGDFTFTDTEVFAHKSITYFASPTQQNNAWSETTLANYARFSVTITSGDVLQLAAFGGTGDNRGFLNAVQIVNTTPIPEPASATLLLGVGAITGTALRRRRR
ncbi:MAG: PEP-CTERM sorting domain-containing protein [Verrucomicrobiota bacterium]